MQTHNRATALREAESLVGQLEPSGEGWMFRHFDKTRSAWRESSPCAYNFARKLRSATVATMAHAILCGDSVDAISAQEIALSAEGKAEDRLYAILRALPVPAHASVEA